MSKSFEHLDVWKKAVQFAATIYAITKDFPQDERFGLTNQIRRAAVSISSNLAEGSNRSEKEFVRYIDIAIGSLNEVESQLHVAELLSYLGDDAFIHIKGDLAEIGGLLGGLRKHLRNK